METKIEIGLGDKVLFTAPDGTETTGVILSKKIVECLYFPDEVSYHICNGSTSYEDIEASNILKCLEKGVATGKKQGWNTIHVTTSLDEGDTVDFYSVRRKEVISSGTVLKIEKDEHEAESRITLKDKQGNEYQVPYSDLIADIVNKSREDESVWKEAVKVAARLKLGEVVPVLQAVMRDDHEEYSVLNKTAESLLRISPEAVLEVLDTPQEKTA
jgi:hypothetical protein